MVTLNFKENLKKLRKEKNISQEQLAEKLNISRQAI
ncbi:helix-turn-helix transcriptional regulator [Clostridium sp.]